MLPKRQASRTHSSEGLFPLVTALAAVLLLALVGGIFWVVLRGAWPAMSSFGLGFLVSTAWDPVQNVYGAAPVMLGTLVTSLLALMIAGPLGVATAVYVNELAPSYLRRPISFAVELLAAVPSVVYGLWGLFVLAPWIRTGPGAFLEQHFGFLPIFRGPSLGVGVLTAGILLAIMILPTITALTREVLRGIPLDLREAIFALGATRWEMIARVVLPNSKTGIIGALLLGLGRAIGEAMAVTMVIGNANRLPVSLLAPAQTAASLIVNEFPEAFDLQLSSLLLLGLWLFVITSLVNVAAIWLVYRPAPVRAEQGGLVHGK